MFNSWLRRAVIGLTLWASVAYACAQVPGIFQPVLTRVPAQAVLVSSSSSASGGTTFTFSGLNFGTAFAGRYLFAVVGVRNASSTFSFSSVTIGGIAGTAAVTAPNTGAAVQNSVAIYTAPVPTGTSGNVVVTVSSSSNYACVGLYSVSGLHSVTATSTNTSIANSPSAPLTILPGGFGIAVVWSNTSPFTNPAISWTNLTKNFEEVPGSVANCSGATSNSINGFGGTVSTSISNASAGSSAGAFAAFR